MKFEKYGVTFREIEHDDIEMVRQWRNNPEVSKYMISQEKITSEMQEKWFRGISQRNEKHYVVSFQGADLGLFSIKDIDTENNSAEFAMYMAHVHSRNTHLPYLISIGIEDEIQRLGIQKLKIYILDENKRAIRFNKSFGFKPTTIVKNGNIRLYWLDYDEYKKSSIRLKRLLKLKT